MLPSKVCCGFLVSVLISGAAPLIMASEGGGSNAPLGVGTLAPAILPPLGENQLYGYILHYSSNSIRNRDGSNSAANVELDSYAQALRVVHTWDREGDGNVKFGTGITLAMGRGEVVTQSLSEGKNGLSQVYFTPLYVTWSPTDALHLLTGFGTIIPVGNYDKNDAMNVTTNYASYVQDFGLTWFPTKNWELSIAPIFYFNAKNDDTDYRSGILMNADFGVNYRPPEHANFQLGIGGHITKQLTDDQLDGHDLPGGYRLSKIAVGPQLAYYFNPATAILFKRLKETEVENGPKGNSLWFEFTLPL